MSNQPMSKEEIRKLLGGYATNTLTESERNTLFEAALDDQELFDALQQEQALKDVLADPVARAEIRQALDQPRRAGSRWWAWGGAIASLAAAAVLLAVFWPRQSAVLEKPIEVASALRTPAPATAAPAPQVDQPKELSPPQAAPARDRKQIATAAEERLKDEADAARPSGSAVREPAPVIPPPVLPPAVAQQGPGGVADRLENAPAQAPGSRARNSFAPMSTATLSRVSTLRYSLIRQPSANSGQAIGGSGAPVSDSELKRGDLIRLQISSAVPGRLVLARLDAAGDWRPIGEVTAEANSNYLLPKDAIAVTGDAQRFRLTLEAVAPQAKAKESRAEVANQPQPVSVEITVAAR